MNNSVGIRELKQNASSVIARVRTGETVTVTDRGVPVARLIPASPMTWDELFAAGLTSAPTANLADIFAELAGQPEDNTLSSLLREMRDQERW